MDYEQKYKEALELARDYYKANLKLNKADENLILEDIFPELVESEDERIRKELIGFLRNIPNSNYTCEEMALWLEKQGDTNETINRDEFAQGVLRGAAIYLINWIDYNAAEGNMCLSNMECKDIEDSLVSGDWGKIYAYLKKKLEKQDEQKSNLRERYKNIADSEWFKKSHENISCGIDDVPLEDSTNFVVTDSKKKQGDKPAWEEDEVRLQACLDTLQAKSLMGKVDTVMTTWLKSLKDRIQPIHEYSDTEKQEMFLRSLRPHFWRPSEEQMEALNDVISSRDIKYDVLSELWKDLNKLTE